jgi:multicomponent Na+:H+ antiporter subunit E
LALSRTSPGPQVCPPSDVPTVFRSLSAAVVLFAFWLLLSGHYTAFLVTAGGASAVAVVLFSRRMDVIDQEGHPISLGWHAVSSYWPWLAKEIVKSAWDVTRRILDPRLPISPTLVSFAPGQRTNVGRVIHANSITLTPGTITVEAGAREFVVHALTREGGAGLAGSEMDRRVTTMEGKR